MRINDEPAKFLKGHIARITTAAELITNSTKDWQVIRQYITNRSEELRLNDSQVKKLERYQFMYNQLVSGKFTDAEVITAVMNLYSIGQSQAYEDLRCSRELFSSVVNVNKRFELTVQLQINRNMLRKAEELCDFKAYASLEKNRTLMLSQIEDVEDNAGEMFTGHKLEAVFDPALIGAETVDMADVLAAINTKRKVKIKTDLFTDISHEEIKPDEQETAL